MLFAAAEIAVEGPTPLYHLPGFYEPFAAISHLVGTGLFVVLSFVVLRRGRSDRTRMVYLTVYAASCVFQFSMSGLYHMMVRGTASHRVLGQLDHAAVFLLIAGIFTPIYGLLYRGWLRRLALLAVWAAATCGILFTTVVANDAGEGLRLAIYQALGWSGIAAMIDLWRRYGFAFIWPMLAGSAMISLAAWSQEVGWPTLVPGVIHAHETFHIILLIGSFHQWLFLWQLADGRCGSAMPANRVVPEQSVAGSPFQRRAA
jgi:hemolysin III